MKTIRRGVFETNSSSTHSITIGSIVKKDPINVNPLLEDGILYPHRLWERSVSIDLGWDSGTQLICRTKEEKAAIIINWVYYLCYCDNNITIGEFEEYCDLVKDACGYKGILILDLDYTIYPYDDNDGNVLEQYSKKELINAILDDNIEIIDSNMPR